MAKKVVGSPAGLILFLETCAVDYSGKVDMRKISDEEKSIIKEWKEFKVLDFGRLPYAQVQKLANTQYPATHWIVLSSSLMRQAAELRLKRAQTGTARLDKILIDAGKPREYLARLENAKT